MKKKVFTGPSFWISPQKDLLSAPIIKIISNISHKRCKSGKISPCKSQLTLNHLQSVLKLNSRHASPKTSKTLKNPDSKPKFVKILKKKKLQVKKKQKLKQKKKKPLSVNILHNLNGKILYKAPPIFENQIFVDVFDEEGNHDRIMETIENSFSFPEIVNESDLNSKSFLIIPKNIDLVLDDYDTTEHRLMGKQPENSFMEKTEDDIKFNNAKLFAKLKNLAKKQT